MASTLPTSELKHKGVTYAQLVEKLADIGINEKEVNVASKLSRVKFSVSFFVAMPKGNRIIAGALGLAAVGVLLWAIYQTGYSLGEQSGEYQANARTYARHAQQDIQHACAGLDGVAQLECTVGVIEATNQHQRAESDLIAQTNMARWALWMLITTAAMAVITAFGVYYVWQTLIATQKMAVDTREIGEAQARPYVSIIPQAIVGFDEGKNPTVHFEVKNSGNTPAFEVSCMFKFALQYGDQEAFKVHFNPVAAQSVGEIPAGSSNRSDIRLGVNLTKEAVSSIRSGNAYFLFAAKCRYRTVFGRRHKTITRAFTDPSCIEAGKIRFYASRKNNRSN